MSRGCEASLLILHRYSARARRRTMLSHDCHTAYDARDQICHLTSAGTALGTFKMVEWIWIVTSYRRLSTTVSDDQALGRENGLHLNL